MVHVPNVLLEAQVIPPKKGLQHSWPPATIHLCTSSFCCTPMRNQTPNLSAVLRFLLSISEFPYWIQVVRLFFLVILRFLHVFQQNQPDPETCSITTNPVSRTRDGKSTSNRGDLARVSRPTVAHPVEKRMPKPPRYGENLWKMKEKSRFWQTATIMIWWFDDVADCKRYWNNNTHRFASNIASETWILGLTFSSEA